MSNDFFSLASTSNVRKFTLNNITFNFNYLAIISAMLYAFKISSYVQKDFRTVLGYQEVAALISVAIGAKLAKARCSTNPTVDEAVGLLNGKNVPVWLINLINCVPTLPKNPDTEVSGPNGNSFCLDRFKTLTDTNTGAIFTQLLTRANISQASTVLRYMQSDRAYKGKLDTLNLDVSTSDIFKFLCTVPSFVQTTQESIPDCYSGNNTAIGFMSAVGFWVNLKFQFEFEYNTVPTVQCIVAAMMLVPTYSLNVRAIFLYGKVDTKITEVGPSAPFWDLLKNGLFSEFPNPEVVQPGQVSEENKDSSSYSQQPQKGGYSPRGKKNKLGLEISKQTSKPGSKVNDLKIDFDLKDVKKRVSKTELDKAKVDLKNSLLNLEKVANIFQIDSGTLLNQASRAWSSAKTETSASKESTKEPKPFEDETKDN